MEEHGLTLEQIEAVPAVNREISSVRIREIDDSSSNPEPIVQGEEADLLLEEFLSPTKLVRNKGHQDIKNGHAPEFSVTFFATTSLFELTSCLIIVHDILCFTRTYVQERMQEDICMTMPFDLKYQNPSGFACFMLILELLSFLPHWEYKSFKIRKEKQTGLW